MNLETDKLRKYLNENYSFDFSLGGFVTKRACGRRKRGVRAGYVRKKGYIEIRIGNSRFFEHNLSWFYFKGSFPPTGKELDHKNRIRNDNRPDNLRLCTRSQNNVNTGLRSDNKVGVRGVYYNKKKKKYCAQLSVNGKRMTIGHYDSIKEASNVIVSARISAYGEFAL